MQAVGQLDDDHSHVLADSDEQLCQVIGSARQIRFEVFHAGAGLANLSNAVNQKSDIPAE